jgi:spermidine synthase
MLHPNPKKILIIGGGDGGALREVLKHKVEKVCMVEIDSDVVAYSKKYLKNICKNSFEDKRLRLIIDDGARFLRNTSDKFDVIIVDSPDPIGSAKILFSKKFYHSLHNGLNKDGIIIRQSASTILRPNELKTSYKLLKKSFLHVAVMIAAIPSYVGGFFSFLIASKKINPQKPNIQSIKRRIKSAKIYTNYYNPEIHSASLCLPNYIRRVIK